MSDRLRIIRLFIGSPKDLAPERQRARVVIDEVNRSVAREMNVRVELVGWEDAQPGAGRPQALINREVDECHVFLGVLWKRWGTPTGTEYSSGFEEEFSRATERRAQTGSPELWLVFKQVDASLLDDPGEDLRKVVAFRKAQELSRKVFFKEVQDIDDWERQLRSWVTTEVVKIGVEEIRSESRPAIDESSPPSQARESVLQEPQHGDGDSQLPMDIRSLGVKLAGLNHQSTNEYLTSFNALSELQVARLHLLSSAWLSSRFTSELLSSHEANLLYRHRAQVHPVAPETDLLLRTLVADTAVHIPGWFWLQTLTAAELSDSLFVMASQDDIAVSAQAITYLARLGWLPRDEADLVILLSALTSTDTNIRRAAADYVAAVVPEKEVAAILHDLSTMEGVAPSEVARLRIRVLMRTNPDAALQQSVHDGAVESDARLAVELSSAVASARSDVLGDCLTSSAWQIRVAAADQLLARGDLPEATAETLLDDHLLRIRAVAILRLIDSGRAFTEGEIRERLTRTGSSASLLAQFEGDRVEPQVIIEHLFRSLPTEMLLPKVDFGSLDGAIAYKVLADREFGGFGRRVRADLADQFAGLQRETEAKLRSSLPAEVADRVIGSVVGFRGLMTGMFSAAALHALVRHGAPPDVEFARTELERVKDILRDDARLPAIQMIERFGDFTDAMRLHDFAQNTYGSLREKALSVALMLSPGPEGVARQLIESKNTDFVRAAIRELWDFPRETIFPLIYSCLSDSRDDVREYAAAYLAHHVDSREIPGLLNSYTSSGQYFYNVVAWLDRAYYAPAELYTVVRSMLFRSVFPGDEVK